MMELYNSNSIYKAQFISKYAALIELWISIKLTHQILYPAIFLTRLA